MKKTIYLTINTLIITTSVLAFIYTGLFSEQTVYSKVFICPITFLICYSIAFNNALKGFKPFITVFISVSYIRYVILPFFLVYEYSYGTLTRVPVPDKSYTIALALMIWELICVTITYLIVRKKEVNQPKTFEQHSYDSESNTFYILFIVLICFLVLLFPDSLNQFHFITSTFNDLFAYNSDGLMSKLIPYLLNIVRQMVFILLLYWLSKEREDKQKGGFIGVLLLASLLSIYYGSNRADYLMMSIAAIITYYTFFPKTSKLFAGIAAGFSATIIVFFSIARFTGAKVSTLVSRNVDAYFGGLPNVAVSVATKMSFAGDYSLLNFIFELFRPMLGIGLLLKNTDILTSSDYFNMYIYGRGHVSQIIPMIGEGYMYFGFFLAPMLTIAFFLLGIYIQGIHLNCRSPLLGYFLLVSSLRLGWLCGQNAMIQLNDLSYNLLLILILYFLSIKLVKKRIHITFNAKRSIFK